MTTDQIIESITTALRRAAEGQELSFPDSADTEARRASHIAGVVFDIGRAFGVVLVPPAKVDEDGRPLR